MTPGNTLKISILNILKNKMRSFLTALGVIIGVASVVVMVGIGTGSQQRITSEINSMGTNLIMIFAGGQRRGGVSQGAGSSTRLSLEDYALLKSKGSWIQAISPQVSTQAQVIYSSYNWRTSINGVSEEYRTIRDYEMAEGTFFSAANVRTSSSVAVLGRTVVDELFPYDAPIGKEIRIGKVPFRVIGVLATKGSSGFGQDQDDIILVPYTTAMNKLTGNTNLRSIVVSTISPDKIGAEQDEITRLLRNAHRLRTTDENDFSTGSQTEITERATAITGTMTLLLGSIAAVSLLVGGIGIMNIMLVSVKERTREIGLRMAVGARGADILLQFLIEALVLSLFGGIIGMVLSFAIAAALNTFTDLSIVIDLSIVMIALIFSGSVGIFFGFYPAKKASELNPIDALRYE